jgi:hypothetical protein
VKQNWSYTSGATKANERRNRLKSIRYHKEKRMTQQQSPVWFITGCSTGFGKELARIVLARGWRAVVTARNPDQVKDLISGHEENALGRAT